MKAFLAMYGYFGLLALGWLIVGLLAMDAYAAIGTGHIWPLARAISGSFFYVFWFIPEARQRLRLRRRK